MQLVVNDLSAKFPCPNKKRGQDIMKNFIDTYYLVKNVLDSDSIILDKDYRSFELAENYRMEQWLNDDHIDVEQKRRFRRMLNQSFTFDSEEFEQEYQWKLDAEFYHDELTSRSCQFAYETDGILISFLSNPYWEEAVIKGIYTYLDEEGEMISEDASIPNVSCEENAAVFCEEQEKILASQKKESIHSGMDIFMCRDEMFPNLIFCENAIKQLQTEIGGTEAGQVYRRLLELQKTASEMGKKFDKEKLTHATPESKVTLQQFEEEHKIMMPDGTKQVFSWHVRFTGGYGGRIFFEPRPEEEKIYIGHIGKKLPTVKYH